MKKHVLGPILAALILSVGASPSVVADVGIDVEFSEREISVIRAWYRDHEAGSAQRGNGAKGNNKGRKSLPPGIAMNLQRGKSLPPGIAKQALPRSLLDLLPAPRRGYERVVVDGKVLLVEIATQVIHDVLEDAILN